METEEDLRDGGCDYEAAGCLDQADKERLLTLINAKQQVLSENVVRCDEMLLQLYALRALLSKNETLAEDEAEAETKNPGNDAEKPDQETEADE